MKRIVQYNKKKIKSGQHVVVCFANHDKKPFEQSVVRKTRVVTSDGPECFMNREFFVESLDSDKKEWVSGYFVYKCKQSDLRKKRSLKKRAALLWSKTNNSIETYTTITYPAGVLSICSTNHSFSFKNLDEVIAYIKRTLKVLSRSEMSDWHLSTNGIRISIDQLLENI